MKAGRVVVVGAGLAGLRVSLDLARRGLPVLLADRKADPASRVHTTGIFVRRTFEEFPFPSGSLGPAIRHVTLLSPSGRPLPLESPRDEFRIGRMGPLYQSLLAECLQAGVEWRPATSFISAQPV